MEGQLEIDNSIYGKLGDRWYEAYDDPVALLRAESKLTGSWIERKISEHFGPEHFRKEAPIRVLDVGCGGGFLSNRLARSGHRVTGLDLSSECIDIAKCYDGTRSVRYVVADARHLPFAQAEFDVVAAMDFLEHVENPQEVIQEMSRVLRPGGLFFFHTFNRNVVSWLVVIKFVEWFIKNVPSQMHILRMFIKPKEMKEYCSLSGMLLEELQGTRPNVFRLNVLKSIPKREIPRDFSFSFTSSCLLGYVGMARKLGKNAEKS